MPVLPCVTIRMVKRLLLVVSLPMVSWSSRAMFDMVPDTGNLGAATLAAFPTAAGEWSNTSHMATEPAIFDFAGVTPIEIGYAPGVPCGVDELVAYLAPKNALPDYAFNAYLTRMPDVRHYSGIGTSTVAMNFTADSRSTLLSMDRGANYVTRLVRGKTSAAARPASRRKDDSGMDIMNPHAPAAQWLRMGYSQSESAPMDVIDLHRPMGEALALCLIGLIAMIPSMLRHRGEIGGSHTGRRRRPYRDAIPPSPER